MQPLQPTLAVANPRLLGLVRETVLSPLLDAFTDVVDGLREPLMEHGARARVDPSVLIDGLYALRQQRDAVLGAYRSQLVRAWQALESGNPLPVQLSFDHKRANLGLVQHEALEVQLAIHHLADTLTREWKSELLLLNGYLTWVDPGLRLDADSNPFSPAQIAMAVYEGFSAIALPGTMRVAAVRCCERDLIELVGPIYESVYSILIHEFGTPGEGTTHSRQSQIPGADTEPAEPEPDWLTRFFGQWEGAESGAAESASAVQGVKATGDSASTLPPALHQLLKHSRAAREQVPGRVQQGASRTTLSQRELISILTLLQIAPDSAVASMVEPPGPLLPRLKKQMFQTAGLLGVEPDAVKLEPADENIVDLIGLLFQVMFEESDLSAGQREVLGKLIAPMTKVALQDRQLFLQSTHPARRLLNVLTEACDGNRGESAAERELLEKVEATVGRLTLDYDESQTVFRALRGDFNGYYAEYRDRAELAEREAAERQRLEDSLEKARNWARTTLHARTEGQSIPAPVGQILSRGWVAHAAALEVGGKGHAALMQIDGLLQALQAAQKESTSPGSSAVWESVADWLQPIWMSMGKSRKQISDARATLVEALRENARASALPAIVMPLEAGSADGHGPQKREADKSTLDPTANVVGPLTAEELQAAVDFDNVTADYFSRLPVGTWLDFIGRDNRVQAGKLSWVSPISSRLLFVTRSGARIAVASAQELAIMVKLNRLRLHRDDDAFYSAMQSVIDQLEPMAAD
ncbi:MAG TPA: DUF1631 family protein [Pseudoxanthomonas sp.]|nr:DUF1631 family protein [Pseudoxanthomonas sp.]